MARPRLPTKILEMRGTFRDHPELRRPREPKPKAGGFPARAPSHMTAAQRACWREVTQAAPDGVLTRSDVLVVEMTAVLLEEFRSQGASMSSARLNRLATLLGRLGLDPSGRASLVAAPVEKANEFADVE